MSFALSVITASELLICCFPGFIQLNCFVPVSVFRSYSSSCNISSKLFLSIVFFLSSIDWFTFFLSVSLALSVVSLSGGHSARFYSSQSYLLDHILLGRIQCVVKILSSEVVLNMWEGTGNSVGAAVREWKRERDITRSVYSIGRTRSGFDWSLEIETLRTCFSINRFDVTVRQMRQCGARLQEDLFLFFRTRSSIDLLVGKKVNCRFNLSGRMLSVLLVLVGRSREDPVDTVIRSPFVIRLILRLIAWSNVKQDSYLIGRSQSELVLSRI